MVTTSNIADTLGRKKIADAVGVGLTAVSNAVVRGRFPASWYLPVTALAAEAGVDCPVSLFRVSGPTQNVDSGADNASPIDRDGAAA